MFVQILCQRVIFPTADNSLPLKAARMKTFEVKSLNMCYSEDCGTFKNEQISLTQIIDKDATLITSSILIFLARQSIKSNT